MLLASGALCLGVASIIGGATGFGTSLIATPLMLLTGFAMPEVVVINLLATLVTRVAVAYRLHTHINWARVALLALGSIPGAWLGAVTVTLLPAHDLKLAAGAGVMLCGILLAVPIPRQTRTPGAVSQAATGAIGGYLATSMSLNGPPPVLLLTRARLPPLNFLADLAGYFIVTNTVSLTILGLRNGVPTALLWPMLPVVIAAALSGNFVGLWIARRLPAEVFRSIVIALVIVAGAFTIASS